MPRVKGGITSRKRHKKILKLAKGYFGSKRTLYRTAHEQVMRSLAYAYRDRKQRKREFRKLWITRINAAAKLNNMKYSTLIHGLSLANVQVNRKMLSDIAIFQPEDFTAYCELAKQALAGNLPKVTPAPKKVAVKQLPPKKVVAKKEVVVEAKNQNVNALTATAVNMKNPTIAGAGSEPKVVGYAFGLKEGETSKLIEGNKGVFMITVTKKNPATPLDNYQPIANRLSAAKASTIINKMYEALKDAADIEDNRANFY